MAAFPPATDARAPQRSDVTDDANLDIELQAVDVAAHAAHAVRPAVVASPSSSPGTSPYRSATRSLVIAIDEANTHTDVLLVAHIVAWLRRDNSGVVRIVGYAPPASTLGKLVGRGGQQRADAAHVLEARGADIAAAVAKQLPAAAALRDDQITVRVRAESSDAASDGLVKMFTAEAHAGPSSEFAIFQPGEWKVTRSRVEHVARAVPKCQLTVLRPKTPRRRHVFLCVVDPASFGPQPAISYAVRSVGEGDAIVIHGAVLLPEAAEAVQLDSTDWTNRLRANLERGRSAVTELKAQAKTALAERDLDDEKVALGTVVSSKHTLPGVEHSVEQFHVTRVVVSRGLFRPGWLTTGYERVYGAVYEQITRCLQGTTVTVVA